MADLFCRDCGLALPSGVFPGVRESRILAVTYCNTCFQARSQRCQGCGGGLRAEDFEEGRAVALAGRRYCEACFQDFARIHRRAGSAEPAGDLPASTGGRRHGRFIPDPESVMELRAGGLGGLFRGERLRLWLDVSEGGFRAVLDGNWGEGDLLRGLIRSAKENRSYPFTAEVRHARPAPGRPGCAVAGCRFIDPSIEFTTFIRASTGGRPVRLPGARPA